MIDNLSKKFKKYNNNDFDACKPVQFNLNNSSDCGKLSFLLNKNRSINIIDTYDEQVEEYEVIKDPKLLTKELLHKEEIKKGSSDISLGTWFYYPWKNTLVHCLDKNKFRTVRLSRNNNLITASEQKKLNSVRVGIAGLNVGNPAAVCLAQVGVGDYLKLADNDILSLSNLNRFRAGLPDFGVNKAVLTARQIAEIDPFIKLEVLPKGIVIGKEDEFLLKPKVDILIEEVDNLPLKLSLRQAAKKNRIPVVMVTGNGSNVIIDIERFDKEKNLQILNGHLSDKVKEKIGFQLPLRESILLARDFMGKKHLVKELQESFLEVGVSLAGIPQLAEASFLRGAVLCYFVRKISLGENIPSGRYKLSMDKIIK